MKLLLKNTIKKMQKSLGRFLSILFIIALGVSVYIGLQESTTGMLYTADHYYDETNLMDFKVTSTMGLNEDDLKAIKQLNNIEKVIASYSADVVSNGKSIRLHAIEEEVNNVTLLKGTMPKTKQECVADYINYKIGDTISFSSDKQSSILSINECKVVGTIKSSLYVRDEKGISTVGNGKLASFVFVKKDAFQSEYYTEVYLIANNSRKEHSYLDHYSEVISPLKEELKRLNPIRETLRYEEILKEANNQITKIQNELEEKIKVADEKLIASKVQLDRGKQDLESMKKKTIREFDNNKAKLLDEKQLLLSSLTQFGLTETDIDSTINMISDTMKQLTKQLELLETDSQEYVAIQNKMKEQEDLSHQLIEVKSNLSKINGALTTLDNQYHIFQNEIAKQETTLQIGYQEYEQGYQKLESSKREANQKIEEAQLKVKEIEKPVWYLLDRTDNSGYISYREDIVKVDAIAKLLPIFFVIIVILMILNTLTRLIEEERNEIGILQSNGFSKTSIVLSYLAYVCSSGLLGVILGFVIGYGVIPPIVYSAFLARYYVPSLITIIDPTSVLLVTIFTLFVMIGVTIGACWKELKEVPSSLLRPRPPKSGKKVFLERMRFIWSKLSFLWKTTIRNIFRYKKRIVMTVLGVAGCTALLVTGMGLNDSIDNISKLQYRDIIKYDAMYILQNNVEEIPENLATLFLEEKIDNLLLVSQSTYKFSFDHKTEDVYMVVPSNSEIINQSINLKSIVTNATSNIKDDGVIITKQMAQHLKAKRGDNIAVRNSDNQLFYLKVSDIVENYVSHYIYLSKNYYKEIFHEDINYNTILTTGTINQTVKLSDYGILMVNHTSDIISNFNSFVTGLNKIIIMIIVLACFLAFLVLYNLTIINVSERKREIATFKVLGFYDKEISSFVYRETLMLTLVGIGMGLILGKYLHLFVMSTAETDNIMFLRQIDVGSYLLAALLTLLFSVIVQLIVNKSLKKIDMIDSLKSIE